MAKKQTPYNQVAALKEDVALLRAAAQIKGMLIHRLLRVWIRRSILADGELNELHGKVSAQ